MILSGRGAAQAEAPCRCARKKSRRARPEFNAEDAESAEGGLNGMAIAEQPVIEDFVVKFVQKIPSFSFLSAPSASSAFNFCRRFST